MGMQELGYKSFRHVKFEALHALHRVRMKRVNVAPAVDDWTVVVVNGGPTARSVYAAQTTLKTCAVIENATTDCRIRCGCNYGYQDAIMGCPCIFEGMHAT